jgi:chemotaxis response regulator CheB
MANDDVETGRGTGAPDSSGVTAPYVVGVGASAGGLAALRTLFGEMPRAPGFFE